MKSTIYTISRNQWHRLGVRRSLELPPTDRILSGSVSPTTCSRPDRHRLRILGRAVEEQCKTKANTEINID